MRVLRRTVYFTAVAAVLASGLAACSSGTAGAGAVATTPGSPGQVVAVSRDVSFVVDGTTTYGTLDVPAHRSGQRLAAALLLAGSGPTDRNGNDVGANLTPYTLQLIAGELARMGIMSLRFDKYFAGLTGGGAFAADPSSIDLAAYIRQAVAASTTSCTGPASRPAPKPWPRPQLPRCATGRSPTRNPPECPWVEQATRV